MAASTIPTPLVPSRPQILSTNFLSKPSSSLLLKGERCRRNRSFNPIQAPFIATRAIDGGSASDLAPVEISWQIAAGALAGVTPFIVAAVEFGKRIACFFARPLNSASISGFWLSISNIGLSNLDISRRDFSQVAQRRCGVCEGSGLVLRGESYSRCPTCGGFLPWRSWKRFFTG